MTAHDLIARFPQIPPALRGHATLDRYASTFADLLGSAQKPSPCSASAPSRAHMAYLKLIGPLELVAIGLATKERALADMEALIARAEADRDGLIRELIPQGTPNQGGGCS